MSPLTTVLGPFQSTHASNYINKAIIAQVIFIALYTYYMFFRIYKMSGIIPVLQNINSLCLF